ncbi:small GTPase EhRabX19, putative [Entamoeba histolytica HM-3:IMSS]|uniref:Small GTPase EhRabX19, putative n=1 Tax=Entamoeba histolytica HM-3:IMSS TaxID=885315 RepID=M7VZU8_ENTHI|nr:small GTPase EhRabX19, putative [Entamoeba histolytica HM-3:IMSS]
MSKTTAKILLIGESGVGKTAMLQRLTQGTFDGIYTASVGVDLKTKIVEINGEEVIMEIWDAAGQERFRSVTQSYYRGTHAAVIVFDLTDKTSFEMVGYWLSEMEKDNNRPIIALVGNKSDLSNARTVPIEVIRATYPSLRYFECSAVNGKNIEEIFVFIAQQFIQRIKSNTAVEYKEFQPNCFDSAIATEDQPITIKTVHNENKCC